MFAIFFSEFSPLPGAASGKAFRSLSNSMLYPSSDSAARVASVLKMSITSRSREKRLSECLRSLTSSLGRTFTEFFAGFSAQLFSFEKITHSSSPFMRKFSLTSNIRASFDIVL